MVLLCTTTFVSQALNKLVVQPSSHTHVCTPSELTTCFPRLPQEAVPAETPPTHFIPQSSSGAVVVVIVGKLAATAATGSKQVFVSGSCFSGSLQVPANHFSHKLVRLL